MKYLYLAKSGNFIKIGASSKPLFRIKQLAINDPRLPPFQKSPELIHATVAEAGSESALHRALEHYRVAGEWYFSGCLKAPAVVAFLSAPADFGPVRDEVAISAKLPKALWFSTKTFCLKSERTVANVVAEALREYLKRRAA